MLAQLEVEDATVIGKYKGTRSAFSNSLSGSFHRPLTPDYKAELERKAEAAKQLVRDAMRKRGKKTILTPFARRQAVSAILSIATDVVR